MDVVRYAAYGKSQGFCPILFTCCMHPESLAVLFSPKCAERAAAANSFLVQCDFTEFDFEKLGLCKFLSVCVNFIDSVSHKRSG